MHPARIAILEILRDGEHCVCDLMAAVDAVEVAERHDGTAEVPRYLTDIAPSLHAVTVSAGRLGPLRRLGPSATSIPRPPAGGL